MNNQITLVSAPDDVFHSAFRILLADLTPEQTQVVSESLLKLQNVPSVVLYVWTAKDATSWLVDKRLKSDLIFFNADSERLDIVGHLASQPDSYYFGNLKELSIINNKTIYSIEDFTDVLTNLFGNYEK